MTLAALLAAYIAAVRAGQQDTKMTTKNDIKELVESKCGKNWSKKEAAVDSLWYSIQTGRPAKEAIRGLANATSHGPCAPSEGEMREAEELYGAIEEVA